MKITRIEATEAYIPLEAPIVYAYGLIRGFSRTIVEVYTDDGIIGISETGASAQQVKEIGDVAVGQNPFDLEIIRMLIASRYYQSRDALIIAAIEMACIDIQGKITSLPAYRLLGGAIRPTVPLVAYCFYRRATDALPSVWTPDELAAHAADLVSTYGYGTVKLKGGVQEPSVEVATVEALRERLGPDIHLRLDPQAAIVTAASSAIITGSPTATSASCMFFACHLGERVTRFWRATFHGTRSGDLDRRVEDLGLLRRGV